MPTTFDANPNAFVEDRLDRMLTARLDPEWVSQQHSNAKAVFLPFWRGHSLLEGVTPSSEVTPDALTPALLPMKMAPIQADMVLLGHLDARPIFALDVTANAPTPEAADYASLGRYTSLKEASSFLSREALSVVGLAYWLLRWRRHHRFSGHTGVALHPTQGGIRLTEPNDSGEMRIHYPRIHPVSIVLPIHDPTGESRCLLGRGPHFPPNMYSCIAGYMEPGETPEDCAKREAKEEVGLDIFNIRYQCSQPWPMSQSLMMGFLAESAHMNMRLDAAEIAEAKWVSKAEIVALLGGEKRADIFIPPPVTIAHQLLKKWVSE